MTTTITFRLVVVSAITVLMVVNSSEALDGDQVDAQEMPLEDSKVAGSAKATVGLLHRIDDAADPLSVTWSAS